MTMNRFFRVHFESPFSDLLQIYPATSVDGLYHRVVLKLSPPLLVVVWGFQVLRSILAILEIHRVTYHSLDW